MIPLQLCSTNEFSVRCCWHFRLRPTAASTSTPTYAAAAASAPGGFFLLFTLSCRSSRRRKHAMIFATRSMKSSLLRHRNRSWLLGCGTRTFRERAMKKFASFSSERRESSSRMRKSGRNCHANTLARVLIFKDLPRNGVVNKDEAGPRFESNFDERGILFLCSRWLPTVEF
jgi:hypothetical protein